MPETAESRGDKLLANPKALANMASRIAYEAGEITMNYFDPAGLNDAEAKGDGSPVTKADREAEACIEARLAELVPDVPMLAEEAVEAGRIPDLNGRDYFWCVDPLDGTKDFVAGKGDFTVNIALMHNNAPLIGVVYTPYNGEMYIGSVPDGATRWLEDSENEKGIQVRRPPAEGLDVVASSSHGDTSRQEAFLDQFKVRKLIKRGSSMKICAIAAGKADLYPRFGPTCEWDTAAAHAVLQAAGGDITQIDGQPLVYGGKGNRASADDFRNPEFLAFGDRALIQGLSL